MKKSLLAIAISMICYGCIPSYSDRDVDREIRSAIHEYIDAIVRGNAELVSDFYTLDGQAFPPNQLPITGKDQILDFWEDAFEMGISGLKIIPMEFEGSGKSATEIGIYKMYVEGNIKVDEGKYCVLWKKVDGKWKIHRDIFNSNLPAKAGRAVSDEKVMAVNYFVKADKRAEFEQFFNDVLWGSASKLDAISQQAFHQSRILHPLKPSGDGVLNYLILMDPVVEGVTYSIRDALQTMYGKQKAQDYYKQFKECLEAPSQRYELKQSAN